jgi:hypothetical protein
LSTQNLTKKDEAKIRRLVLKSNGRNYSGNAWINYNENMLLVKLKNGEIESYQTYAELLQDPAYVQMVQKVTK